MASFANGVPSSWYITSTVIPNVGYLTSEALKNSVWTAR